MTAGRRARQSGISMIEILVVIAIAGILGSLAAPSFRDFIDKYRLRGAADSLHDDLQLARSISIKNNQVVYVNVSPGASWCYGMNALTACTCTTAGNCGLKQVSSTDFTGITLATSTFAADPSFDPVRGIATSSGSVSFESATGKQAQVNLNLLGKVGVCSPAAATTAGYPAC